MYSPSPGQLRLPRLSLLERLTVSPEMGRIKDEAESWRHSLPMKPVV